MISHLLLDADGVLQGLDDSGVLKGRIGAVLGLDAAGVEEFLEVAWAAERPCLSGEARWPEVLPTVLERWGAREHAAEVLDLWCTTEVRAPSLGLALRVREQGVRCWLASNQDEHRASVMEQRFGYGRLLDGSFYSYELGAAKPDTAYFTALLAQLGAAPDTVAFVDDRADNVETARSLGVAGVCWSWREGVASLEAQLRAVGVAVGVTR